MTAQTKYETMTGRERLAMSVSDEALAFKRDTLAELSADLLTKPVHALRWCGEAIEAAARLSVAGWMNEALSKDASLEEMRTAAEKRMRHSAQYPARSTSPVINLSDDEERMAWMDALLKIEEAIAHDEAEAARA